MFSSIHLLASTGESFQPLLQVETISTRLEPLPCMLASNACNGKIIGCLTNEDELIAMGVYAKKGYDESNYAYDIGLNGEEVFKVAQIESTIVKSEYRGNKLQRLICEELEKIARKDNIEILTATASPYNEFSVNTFMNLGYEIKKDKLKYGGLRRYVLVKEL